MSKSICIAYGTMFVGIGVPLLWISIAWGVVFIGIGLTVLVRAHLMEGESKAYQKSPFPTAKEIVELQTVTTHSKIANFDLEEKKKDQRIEGIRQRIYSEQARVEAETTAAGKPFAGLIIPQTHWNQFFLTEHPDEVAEAFRRRTSEMQRPSGTYRGQRA